MAVPSSASIPPRNLYLNGGWCYQGFKATPATMGWCLAHTIAHETEHPLIRHLALDRFERNNGFDEYGTGLWTYKQ